MSKTAILPQVRVAPELRAQAEAALRPGEKLSDLVETAVRRVLEQRAMQQLFEEHSRASLEHFVTQESDAWIDCLGSSGRGF